MAKKKSNDDSTIRTGEYSLISLASVIPYTKNARTHSAAQIKQIASSITKFGFTNPILVDEKNNLIAGHGRCMAAKELGMLTVPAVKLSGLFEAERQALILADNKLALNAGWDDELLRSALLELRDADFDLELTGFGADEIEKLLSSVEKGLCDEDDVPEVPIDPVSVMGDVWRLGDHRLMCGDSTSIDAVQKLMGGEKVDMVFTDPPYNVAFNGRSGKHDVIKNDDLEKNAFETFIQEVCNTIKAIDPKAYYIWCNWNFYAVLQNKLAYKACIVWAKNVFGLGRGYRHQHEFCLFNGKVDEVIKNESDLWEVKKDSKYVHPTQKPVALSVRAFGNHIKLVNILDLFGGSGSTLIGAEQTGRKAFLMELDPKYCDVIIKRWEDFTGKKAILESTGETFEDLKNKKLKGTKDGKKAKTAN